jgi:hypothetical protein
MDLDSSDLFFEDPMSNKQKESRLAQGTTAVGDIADGAAKLEDGVKVGVHLNDGVDDGADGVDDGSSDGSGDGADGVDDGSSDGSGDGADGVDDGSSDGSGDGADGVDDGSSDGSGDGSSDGSGDGSSSDDVNSEDEKNQDADETSTSLDRSASTTRAWDETSENSPCESPTALSDSSGHLDMVNVFNAEFKKVYDSRVVTAHLRNEDIPAAQAYVASLRNHVSHKLSIKEGQRRKVAPTTTRGPTAPMSRVVSTSRVVSSAKKQKESAKPPAPRYTFLSDDEDSNTNESEETSQVRSSRHPPVNTTEVVPDVVQESTMSRVGLTVQHEVKIRRLRQLRDIFNASPYFDMEDIENVTAEIRESEAFIENMLEPLTKSLKQVLRMQVVVKHREIIIEKAVNNNLLNHHEDAVFAKLVSKQVHLLKLVNQ